MMKRVKLVDIIIIASVVLTAAVLFAAEFGAANGEAAYVLVSYAGETRQYPLDIDRTIGIESGGFHLEVTVCDRSVFVSQADCPDKTCVHTGRIARTGGFIACVPAGVYIKITGGGEANRADFIAG